MEEPPSRTTTADEVSALVAEGNAALSAGDSYRARLRFRRALELDPERAEAWVGLAGSVRPYRERREHLRRALELDPANPAIRAMLAQVEERLAAGEVLAPGGTQSRAPAPVPAEEPAPVDVQYCYIHPNRETGLQCTSCGRPICGECAQRAAVGQLCPECRKARRPVNYQVSGATVAIAGGVTAIYSIVVSTLGLMILGRIGFFSFIVAFLLGPVAGDLLVRLLDRVTRAKRGRTMQLAVGLAYGAGIVFMICGLALALGILSPLFVGQMLFSLPLGHYLFSAIAIITALTRLR